MIGFATASGPASGDTGNVIAMTPGVHPGRTVVERNSAAGAPVRHGPRPRCAPTNRRERCRRPPGASRQLDRWVADVDAATKKRDLRTRLTDAWLDLRDGARSLWGFELFEVEDTAIADGKSIVFTRGVTLGKSVGAILLFLFGFLALTAITRHIERRLVERGLSVDRARMGKRMILSLCVIVLLVVTLNVARIPVTVFAFMGGALALGVGFGSQTLIKNLVSGIVVAMERKVRIGDSIEIDNFAGRITEVTLRSCTVDLGDGSQGIIPNSMLMEHKLVNWTRRDRHARRVVRVDVAFDSPECVVADMLLECAKGHDAVLSDPAPTVILEDFREHTLKFALFIWVQLGAKVSDTKVLSDLRFRIKKRLSDAGIAMALPQRDLRLDSTHALRVEVVRDQQHDSPA